GLIQAIDLAFDNTLVGDTECKTLVIKNVGSAAFSLTGFLLSDSIDFSVDTSVKKFPSKLAPGGAFGINICFHPQSEGLVSGGIDWQTDLEASFKHSVKDHSSLSGEASPKASVETPYMASLPF